MSIHKSSPSTQHVDLTHALFQYQCRMSDQNQQLAVNTCPLHTVRTSTPEAEQVTSGMASGSKAGAALGMRSTDFASHQEVGEPGGT